MKQFMRFHKEFVSQFCTVLQGLVQDYVKQKRELSLIPEDVVSTLIRYDW